jgi:hypothetical protein
MNSNYSPTSLVVEANTPRPRPVASLPPQVERKIAAQSSATPLPCSFLCNTRLQCDEAVWGDMGGMGCVTVARTVAFRVIR